MIKEDFILTKRTIKEINMEFDVKTESDNDLRKDLRRDSTVNAVLLLVFWVIYFAASFALPSIGKIFYPDTESAEYRGVVSLAFYVLLYPIGFPITFLVFRKLSRKYKDMKVLGCFRKPVTPPGWTIKWIFLTIGFTYAAAFLSNLIFYIIETLTGLELTEAEMSSDNSLFGILTVVIAAPVFAPIFEELFFRGTLYRNVREHGTWSMMIVCGLTFGLWHANYPQFLFASVMGFFSCFLYEKTRSIIPSMAVHFLINSMGAFATILTGALGFESKDELAAADIYKMMADKPLLVLVLMMLGLFICALLISWLVVLIIEIAFHRESFRIEKTNPEIPEEKKIITYLTSPLMLITMLGMLGLTIFRALGGDI